MKTLKFCQLKSRATKVIWLIALFQFGQMAIGQTDNLAVMKTPGVQYQLIGTYDTEKLDAILTSELEQFLSGSTMSSTEFIGSFPKAKYPVKLYRIVYPSVVPEFDNRPTMASGLVAIPEIEADTLPLLMYQHGTTYKKNEVPSFPENSMETRIMLARFASQGYVVIAADYFGKGLSDLPDSYLVLRSTQQACVDMLLASKSVLAEKDIETNSLFISGWSQGGWSTLVLLQKLEALGVEVTAAATASAPADGMVIYDRWFNNYQPIDAVYLPACVLMQIKAQEYYHQQNGLTASAVRPEFLQASLDFCNEQIDWDTFSKRTTNKLQEYLLPEFMAGGNACESPYWQVLNNSQAYRWRSHTPMHNYYGGADEVVPVEMARLPEIFQNMLGGGPTTAVYAGDSADHRATFLYSVLHSKPWFDDFLK